MAAANCGSSIAAILAKKGGSGCDIFLCLLSKNIAAMFLKRPAKVNGQNKIKTLVHLAVDL